MTRTGSAEAGLKILAVEDHPVTLDGLRLALESISRDVAIQTTGSIDEAIALVDATDDLSLMLIEPQVDRRRAFELIAHARRHRAGLPVVVFSAEDDAPAVRFAFDAGVSGYLSKRSTRDILVGALRLVLVGGLYVPPVMLEAGQPRDTPGPYNLTGREAEVLSLLAQGMSNKVISRELSISESTTKTHVSSIMRALQVKNRTEVSALMGRLR